MTKLTKKDVRFYYHSDRGEVECIELSRLVEAREALKKQFMPRYCSQCENVICFFPTVHERFHKYNRRRYVMTEIPDLIDNFLLGEQK